MAAILSRKQSFNVGLMFAQPFHAQPQHVTKPLRAPCYVLALWLQQLLRWLQQPLPGLEDE